MAAEQKPDIFQALADPTRRKILKMLAYKELPVTVISNQFPISRTAYPNICASFQSQI